MSDSTRKTSRKIDKIDLDDALSDELTAEELRGIAQEVSALYPPPRLGTELILLEIDPHRVHAYWNIDVEDHQAILAENGLESPDLLLRIYDITGVTFDGHNAHSYFDIQVQGLQGHWYVDLWQDGRAYVGELGLRRTDGGFARIARSNAVFTPSAAQSAQYDTRALDVQSNDTTALRLMDLLSDPNLSPENVDADTGAPVLLNAPPVAAIPPADAADYRAPDAPALEERPAAASIQPSVPPTPVEPKAFPMPPDATPWQRVDAFFAAAETAVTAAPVIAPPPLSVMPPAAQAKESARAPAPAEPRATTQQWPSGEELARHVPNTSEQAPRDVAHPSSEEHKSADTNGAAPAPAPQAPAAPPTPTQLPLDSYVNLSSYENGRAHVDLEVNVELHIYGRAKPGKQLTFYGQPVKLQPDGTFSIRKPLPHGAVVLPLLAVDPPPAPPRE